MVTALPLTACLAEARFPVWPEARVGVGFHEINARQSDFAFVSAAAQVALDGDGRCTRAAIGIGAATAVPLRLDAVAEELKGQRFDEAAVREVAQRGARRHRDDGRSARLGRVSQARRRRRSPSAPSPTPIKTPRGGHEGRARHQQGKAHGRRRAAHQPARLPARQAAADRRACRLRAWRLRRLHRAGRRRRRALLPDVRGAGRRLCHHHHRRAVARAGRAVADCRTRSAKPTACSAAIARRR